MTETEFGTIDDPKDPANENGFVLGDTTNTKEHLVPWPDTRYVHGSKIS